MQFDTLIFLPLTLLESLLAMPILASEILKFSIFKLVSSPAEIALSKVLLEIIFFKFTSEPERSMASPPILLKLELTKSPLPKSISIASDIELSILRESISKFDSTKFIASSAKELFIKALNIFKFDFIKFIPPVNWTWLLSKYEKFDISTFFKIE